MRQSGRESGMKRSRQQERGAALMLAMMVVLMAGLTLAMDALLLYGKRVRDDQRATISLAAAKKSLIAYAAVNSTLPCPVVGGSESSYHDYASVSVVGDGCANTVGLFPWAKLQLPPLKDSAEAPIWYTVSGDMACGGGAPLTINGTGDYLVLLFAPGKTLSTQTRDFATPVAQNNYLDGSNGVATTAFLYGQLSGTFNDRILGIACGEIESL